MCKAIEFEVERQIEVLESGGVVVSETRTFDNDSKSTVTMRDKESKRDYREGQPGVSSFWFLFCSGKWNGRFVI